MSVKSLQLNNAAGVFLMLYLKNQDCIEQY